MEMMSMVYFSFQDLMSFGIFIVALLTFVFQNKKLRVYGHRKTAPKL
ncbi:putative holin-like toxin [Phascolarctobacterium succinatutens]